MDMPLLYRNLRIVKSLQVTGKDFSHWKANSKIGFAFQKIAVQPTVLFVVQSIFTAKLNDGGEISFHVEVDNILENNGNRPELMQCGQIAKECSIEIGKAVTKELVKKNIPLPTENIKFTPEVILQLIAKALEVEFPSPRINRK